MTNEKQVLNEPSKTSFLSKQIDVADINARLDANAKSILADKQVLARILKYTLEECAEMSIDDIIASIGDDIDISNVPIDPGMSRHKISLDGQESSIVGEGLVRYDIRFHIYVADRTMKILINVEAQKTSNPNKLGYTIENRMEFYLGRNISEEKDSEFTGSNYDDIKRVKSIWICMDAKIDSITRHAFRPEVIYGEIEAPKRKGLMEGIIIRIRTDKEHSESANKLIAVLEELFGQDSPEEKKKKLEEQGMIITESVGRNINSMCNYSELVMEQGLSLGRIQQLIEDAIEDGKSMEDILNKLINKLSLTRSEAEEYYNKYSRELV